MNEGFLGMAAPRYVDVVVLLEIGMGVALLIGAVLARMRWIRLHAWCQSVIVLLNLVVIVRAKGRKLVRHERVVRADLQIHRQLAANRATSP